MTRPRSLQNWNCLQCGELIPPNFGRCWNCGADPEGRPDPRFVAQRDEPPGPVPPTTWRGHAAGLLATFAIAAALMIAARFLDQWLPPAWSRRTAGILLLILGGICAAVAVNLAARLYPVLSYYIGPGEPETDFQDASHFQDAPHHPTPPESTSHEP